MSDESAQFEAGEVLRAIGKVREAEPPVLEAARETLWSAVAREMLGLCPADAQGTTSRDSSAAGEEESEEEAERRAARRRQTHRPTDDRKTAMGGQDPDP
jgi:hypothetical protein